MNDPSASSQRELSSSDGFSSSSPPPRQSQSPSEQGESSTTSWASASLIPQTIVPQNSLLFVRPSDVSSDSIVACENVEDGDEDFEDDLRSNASSSHQTHTPSKSPSSFIRQQQQYSEGSASTISLGSGDCRHLDGAMTSTALTTAYNHPVGSGAQMNFEEDESNANQERQMLLMMLLAQVASLHDPTPRTFTVHVLELFERGIVDRQSIDFLLQLGLVPSLPTLPSQESSSSSENGSSFSIPSSPPPSSSTALARLQHQQSTGSTTTSAASTTTKTSQQTNLTPQQIRIQEASAIRSHLKAHEEEQSRSERRARKQQQSQKRTSSSPHSPPEQQHQQQPQSSPDSKPWNVEQFPLSLSRYQREFDQVALLNSGSFGSVYHVTRKLDGCDYAMKQVAFDAIGYSSESIQQVVREVKCLAAVHDHPNVVRYYTSWLEPSWMTGGASPPKLKGGDSGLPLIMNKTDASSSNATPQQQQQLLLTDLQNHLMQQQQQMAAAGAKETKESSSAYSVEDTFDHRGRGFSFDESVESVYGGDWGNAHEKGEDTWNSLDNRRRYEESTAYSVEDSIPEDHHRKQHHGQEGAGPKDPPVYRYQICLYIQMQLCHPATLADWLRERNRRIAESDHRGRIGPALEIFQQIVSGLAHIHEKGIIHRDLKPANIFSSSDGKVIKIGDFGLSKQLEEVRHNGTLTPQTSPSKNSQHDNPYSQKDGASFLWQQESKKLATAMVPRKKLMDQIVEYGKPIDPLTAGVGTASYASPEQVSSRSYDTQADVFSLGLILLELVSCFETEHERLHNFQQCRQRCLPEWLHNDYPKIASTILACTRENPRERPLARELADYATRSALGQQLELQRKLVEKDQELKKQKQDLLEKDRIIEQMREEMERMKLQLSSTGSTSNDSIHEADEATVSSSKKKKQQQETIIVEDVEED